MEHTRWSIERRHVDYKASLESAPTSLQHFVTTTQDPIPKLTYGVYKHFCYPQYKTYLQGLQTLRYHHTKLRQRGLQTLLLPPYKTVTKLTYKVYKRFCYHNKTYLQGTQTLLLP